MEKAGKEMRSRLRESYEDRYLLKEAMLMSGFACPLQPYYDDHGGYCQRYWTRLYD